jgi:hypothetical protein
MGVATRVSVTLSIRVPFWETTKLLVEVFKGALFAGFINTEPLQKVPTPEL